MKLSDQVGDEVWCQLMIGNDMKQAPINIVIYSTTKVADDLFGGILTKLILSMFCWRSLLFKEPFRASIPGRFADHSPKTGKLHPSQHVQHVTPPCNCINGIIQELTRSGNANAEVINQRSHHLGNPLESRDDSLPVLGPRLQHSPELAARVLPALVPR